MNTYADLEISLRAKASSTEEPVYAVDMRLSLPDTDTDERPMPGGDATVTLVEDLRHPKTTNWKKYGADLRDAFFRGSIATGFAEARKRAQSKNAILRVRFYIEPKAMELHNVHWETILDPDPRQLATPLFAGRDPVFSRYLISRDFREVRSRPRSGLLKALIVVANPTGADASIFTPIDVAKETELAREAMRGLVADPKVLEGHATIDAIVRELENGYDVLYLVAHGRLKAEQDKAPEATVFLQNATGGLAPTRGAEIVQLMEDLRERPRLVVLASCQSSGNGEAVQTAEEFKASFSNSLGPMLAESGIPAVLAMRGNVSIPTANRFMQRFFEELASESASGEVDRAVAVARMEVKQRSDFWMPVLYMRLRSGRVWYTPGFTQGDFDWNTLCERIVLGEFVPVIGPDLPAEIEGSQRQIAADLARENGFPLAPWDSADLAKVAQYLFIRTGEDNVRDKVRGLRAANARANFSVSGGTPARDLLPQIVGSLLEDPESSYAVLASLEEASVYVTATPDSLLEIALSQKKRDPVELFCRWRDPRDRAQSGASLAEDTDGEPDPKNPTLFYAFGKSRKETQHTWVLTEDDFFDYLIRSSRYQLWPGSVKFKMCNSVLMFLGFSLEDWKFRVLLRMILQMEGAGLLGGKSHVGVQVNPDESTMADVIRAKRYMESYLAGRGTMPGAIRDNNANDKRTPPKVDIYWGTAQDFLKDLNRELTKFRIANPHVKAGSDDDV
ncbi:MAG: CHAT domain-containing protein [Bryobacterales bacterium]|nr:CHAT domain-containing protein [Bryobacterales bacterium]